MDICRHMLGVMVVLSCAQEPPPITVAGVVFDPESLLSGVPSLVGDTQVFLAEDMEIGAVAGAEGDFVMEGVPANFNTHPIAINQPDYARTLDGLGLPVTSSEVKDYYVPILRRDGLLWQRLTEEIGDDPEVNGFVMVGVLDGELPSGRFVRSDLSLAVNRPDIHRMRFVTHDGSSFDLVESVSGQSPEGFAGLVFVSGPAGTGKGAPAVRVTVLDQKGRYDYIPHPMAIEPGFGLLILHDPD